jgi:Tol biopolymer transport system component
VNGTGFSRLTTLGEDSPSASWSPDGTRLALVSGGGIYVLTPSSNDLRVVDAAGGHGAIDWR